MKVNFFATLRQVVGEKSVDFPLPEGSTVRHLLDEMIRCYPALQQELLDGDGQLFGHVHIFVNGRDVPFLENTMDTRLSSSDIISVFPAVGGGGKESIRANDILRLAR